MQEHAVQCKTYKRYCSISRPTHHIACEYTTPYTLYMTHVLMHFSGMFHMYVQDTMVQLLLTPLKNAIGQVQVHVGPCVVYGA